MMTYQDGRNRAGAGQCAAAGLMVLLVTAATGVAAAGSEPASGLLEAGGFDDAALARMTHLTLDQPAAAPAPAPSSAGEFAEGARVLNFYGSAIFGDSGKGEMYLAHGGIGYYFEDYSSINLDVLGGYIRSGIDDDGAAAGVDFTYRTHFHRTANDHQTIYFDAGVGLQQQSTEFSGRRHFNFRVFLGFGTTFEITDQARLMLGARYIHISDAGIDGGGGGFDGPMVYAGVMLPF